MEKKELKDQIYEMLNKDKSVNFILSEEIDKLLDSGYINVSGTKKEDVGYSLAKLVLYLSLRRLSEQYKPLSEEMNKEYSGLIKNY